MPEKLHEQIYNAIKKDVEDGVIKRNTFISEAQIAEKFGVSKGPVKVALKRMCDEYFLILYPSKGYMVRLITTEEFEQIQHLRLCYEQISVKLTIANASDAEILSLKDTLHENNPGYNNNALFHTRWAEITHSEYHYDTIKTLMGFQKAMRLRPEANNHENIISALLERNESKATQMLMDDILKTGEQL